MSVFLLGLLTLIFGIVTLVCEVVDVVRRKSIKLINIFCVMYSLSYGFLTSAILLSYEFFEIKYTRIMYDDNMLNSLWFWSLLAFCGYAIIRLVYKIKLFTPKKILIKDDDDRQNARLMFTIVASLIIGLTSMYLWARAYGGIFELIKVANAVRSGFDGTTNSLAFFKHPARIITFASYATVVLIERKYKKFLSIALFAVSFVASILYLLAGDGRMSMAMYLVILFFVIIGVFKDNINLGRTAIIIGLMAVAAIALMMAMDTITHYIRNGEIVDKSSDGIVKDILDEFAFVLVAGQNSANQFLTEGSPFLIIHDIMYGVFAWLPTSLKPGDFINIWNYNTDICNMYSHMAGQWPTDFVSTSIYTLGPIGIFVFSAFWGCVIKFVDKKHVENNNIFFTVFYYVLSMSFLRLVDYCMLYDFVLCLFYMFVAFIVWKISGLLVRKSKAKR